MKVALVNPSWDFAGSIYFGCREPHLPLELAYTRQLLRDAGHKTLLIDGHLLGLDHGSLADQVALFAPDLTVVTTAPTYLFWRCAPPELRIPALFIRALNGRGGRVAVTGPHASVTPGPTLAKLGADIAIRGECEEIALALAEGSPLSQVPSIAYVEDGRLAITGPPHASAFVDHKALAWPDGWVLRHRHHHHRFEASPDGPGAEVEASRGCPYSCSFCAKLDYRDKYRRRALEPLTEEIDRLIRQGVTYLYFIDEIFLPQRPLLEALVKRPVRFGIQTRIDLWKPDMLRLLGEAGCVSIEAGVESLTEEGRAQLDKNCRMSTEELADRLIEARHHVPFVQANLIGMEQDDPDLVVAWRDRLIGNGVWANDPVPLFPYPSSPDYRKLWGEPDEQAWERAHEHYLEAFARFSDIQEERPTPMRDLEAACCVRSAA
jgi:anaerobic magnesium-protoporphyrin IX monomethyl ester cyclase